MKKKTMKNKIPPLGIFIIIVLILYTVSLIVPLGWGFISSFKDKFEFRTNTYGFPQEWILDNYITSLDYFKRVVEYGSGERTVYMPEMYFNSICYAVGSAFMATLTPCITAYIVAKFPYKPLKWITYLVIVCLTLPIVGSLPSEIQIAQTLGVYDKMWGMWIMKSYFITMYYFVFLSTFQVIPDAYAEAAKIDGAGNGRIMLTIMLPLERNTFFAVFLIKFIENWNDYQTPLMLMPNKPTISLGLYYFAFSTNSALSSTTMELTGCMLVFLPILICYIIFHRYLLSNVTMGGIKG